MATFGTLVGTLALVSWTLLFARTICIRASIRGRTLLGYLALGMVLGATGVFVVHRIINPYPSPEARFAFQYNAFLDLVLAASTLAVVLLPVAFLIRKRVHVLLGSGDLFLIGFALGLGADLIGMLTTAGQSPVQMSVFPPWQQSIALPLGTSDADANAARQVLPGLAYYCGAVALTFALLDRYAVQAKLPVIGAGLVFAVSAVAIVSWNWTGGAAVSAWTARAVAWMTWDGILTAPFVLVLAAGAQFFEERRLGGSSGAARPRAVLAHHARTLLGALWARPFAESRRRIEIFSVERQTETAAYVLSQRPDDPAAVEALPRFERRLAALRAGVPETERRSIQIRVPVRAMVIVPWALLIASGLWPGGLSRVLSLASALAMLGWIVSVSPRLSRFESGDDLAAFYCERAALVGGFATCALVIAAAIDPPLYPLRAAAFVLPSARADVSPELLAMIAAAAALFTARTTLPARAAWSAAESRAVLLPRAWEAVSFVAVAWLVGHAYLMALRSVHFRYGEWVAYVASAAPGSPPPAGMPPLLEGWHFNMPSPFGNFLIAWPLGLLAAAIAVLLLRVVRRLYPVVERMVNRWFVRADRVTGGASAAFDDAR